MAVLSVTVLSCSNNKPVEDFEAAQSKFNQLYSVKGGWYTIKEAPQPRLWFNTEKNRLEYDTLVVNYRIDTKSRLHIEDNTSKGQDCKDFLKATFGFSDDYFERKADQKKRIEIAEKLGIDSIYLDKTSQENVGNVAMTLLYCQITTDADKAYCIKDKKLAVVVDSLEADYYIDRTKFVKFVNNLPKEQDNRNKTLFDVLIKDSVVVKLSVDNIPTEEVILCDIDESKLPKESKIAKTPAYAIWLIIGGSVVLLIAVSVVCWCFIRRRKKDSGSKEAPDVEPEQQEKPEVVVKGYQSFDALVSADNVTIESVLATFDRVYKYKGKKSLQKKYLDQKDSGPAVVPDEDSNKWKRVQEVAQSNKDSVVADILALVDEYSGVHNLPKYQQLVQNLEGWEEIKSVETLTQVLEKCDNLCNNEGKYSEQYKLYIDEINAWRTLPMAATLKEMVCRHDAMVDKLKSGKKFGAEYQTMVENVETANQKLTDYNACCKLIKSNPANLKGALSAAVEAYNNNQTIDGAVEFATKFRVLNDGKDEVAPELVLEKYNKVKDELLKFKSSVADLCNLNELKLKERYLFLMEAVESLFVLLKVIGVEPKSKADSMLDNIKIDIALICVIRQFVGVANDTKLSVADFDNTWANGIKTFNDNNKGYQLSVDKSEKSVKPIFDTLLKKIKTDDFTCSYIDTLWSRFVEKFIKSLDENGIDQQALIESMFNISFHVADYVDYVRNNAKLINCLNLELLLNNFDQDKSTCYEFVHNHLERSNRVSNQVYELAAQLGVESLDIVAGRYKIGKISKE